MLELNEALIDFEIDALILGDNEEEALALIELLGLTEEDILLLILEEILLLSLITISSSIIQLLLISINTAASDREVLGSFPLISIVVSDIDVAAKHIKAASI